MTFFHKFAGNKGAVIGAMLLLLIVLFSLLGPYLVSHSPWALVAAPFVEPFTDLQFPLGTDTLGRDVLSGLAYGARMSIVVGLVSTLVAVLVGVPVGALAGFYGGTADDLLMRLTELFQTVPTFPLAIVIVALFEPSLVSIVCAIGIVSWPPVARLTRGEVLSLRKREYVEAAITTGQSTRRIILRHILPNAFSTLIVMASLMIASAILVESALAFLGLSDPDLMSWGYMVGAGRTVVRQAWWLTMFPGVAILLTALALNLIGEGLSDALNPRLLRREG